MSRQKPERQYVCTFEGCSKAFNRRDYLERHAANRKSLIIIIVIIVL